LGLFFIPNPKEAPMKIDPEEVIFSITVLDVLRAIERRIGKEEANSLSVDDLDLAKEEVVAVIEHSLDVRDYLDEGIDLWLEARNL
jgi:hypothetical protein